MYRLTTTCHILVFLQVATQIGGFVTPGAFTIRNVGKQSSIDNPWTRIMHQMAKSDDIEKSKSEDVKSQADEIKNEDTEDEKEEDTEEEEEEEARNDEVKLMGDIMKKKVDGESHISAKINGEEPKHDDAVLNLVEKDEEVDEEYKRDCEYMRMAIELANASGGEQGPSSPFPNPVSSAILLSSDDRILGKGTSTYSQTCVEAAIADAGIVATPLREWCISWKSNPKLRQDIAGSTLYLTLEPCQERRGAVLPPMTQLIESSGIRRVVIGCPSPIPEHSTHGAAELHSYGISVTMGIEQDACQDLIQQYTALVSTKLHRIARRHLRQTNRPLGLLHCSVIDSRDAASYARSGNAFTRDSGGQLLSMRDFGSYEIAPPPELVWALANEDDEDYYDEDDDYLEFDEEDAQESLSGNPMMPWYSQVNAVAATFPRSGNGPSNDGSIRARLNGLKWLATEGQSLPPAIERILVMDATDLHSLPLTNDDPNLPHGVDIEAFWKGGDRKPCRILLRHSTNAMASAAAEAAAHAAKAAADAALAAKEAVDSGNAELAADAAHEYQKAALAAAEKLQKDVQIMQDLKNRLTSMGVIVESLQSGSGEPIDVMNHLGSRNGYESVVWRAGCWGERGVQAILDGAFQWVSAHLAVDAVGGKFWQLMLAERCVQAACGPEQRVKIFAEQEDISLEYCDDEDADKDCILQVDGRPVRHVRLDCRVGLIDQTRPRKLVTVERESAKQKMKKEEEAPWFL